MPNCPGAKLSGAKLSWCQIFRVANCPLLLFWCQIVCFYYLGAKLSVFIILVPSCPLYYLGAKLSSAKLSGAKLSALLSWCQIVQCQIVWCQIVRFIILVPNCPVPNCLVPNCPTIVVWTAGTFWMLGRLVNFSFGGDDCRGWWMLVGGECRILE